MTFSEKLSPERIKQILEFKNSQDDDCPPLTQEQLKKGYFKNTPKKQPLHEKEIKITG